MMAAKIEQNDLEPVEVVEVSQEDQNQNGSATESYQTNGASSLSLPHRTLSVAGILGRTPTETRNGSQLGQSIERAKSNLEDFNGAVTTAKNEFDTINTDIPDDATHGETDEPSYDVAIKRIISKLIDLNVQHNDEELAELIAIAKDKLVEPHYNKIGIFGKLKAGKSTLLNALTRSEFFPTDSSCPETSLTVSIHHDDGYHQGLCEEGKCSTKHGLKCPVLHVGKKIRAAKSYEIVEVLKSINKDYREQNGKCSSYLCDITSNIPILAKKLVLQDTPGFGEARNVEIKHATTHALYSCNAYVYVLDSSKLGDQLDVDALLLLHKKDPSIFDDGRILIIANQIDCTFQAQAGNRGRTYVIAQQALINIKAKIIDKLNRSLSADFIVPCSAKWAWVARTVPYEDAEDDMEVWKRKLLRVLSLTGSVPNTAKFIEEASQVDQIENWLLTMSLNGEILHKKSVIADIIHCLNTGMELCSKYLMRQLQFVEELISEMEIKRTTWNELIDLMYDMEKIAELFINEVDSAYDEDIERHVQYLKETVTTQLEQFRETCCNKCRPSSQTMDENEQQHNEPQTQHGAVEEEVIVETSNELSVSPGAPPSPSFNDATRSNEYTTSDADVSSKGSYRLNDFKKAKMPLQEFGQNESMLATLSRVLLHYKPENIRPVSFVYNQPQHGGILQENPLALEQLKGLTNIEALHLSWWTRVKLWFKTKIHSNARENYPITQRDVNSAIAFFIDSKCLDDCENYLKMKVKPQIVQCYYKAYRDLVMDTLHDFEENNFKLIETKIKELESDTCELLQYCKDTKTQLEYLVTYKQRMSLEQDRTHLDTSYFTSRMRSMTDMTTIEPNINKRNSN